MSDSIDFVSLFSKNVVELSDYLADRIPISRERLIARQHYEELLKNLSRRALAAGCDPDMLEPDYQILFKQFVQQNVDAAAWLTRRDNLQYYERGRADMQALLATIDVPSSFAGQAGSPAPTYPAVITTAPLSAAADRAPPAPVATTTASEPDRNQQLRFSEALSLYMEEDLENGGNADARSIVSLVVQFIVDMFDDAILTDFSPENAKSLDRMLPDIPDRKGVPKADCLSLSTRYRYAQKHGWEGLKRLTEARIGNNYHDALRRFFGWASSKRFYPHPVHEFCYLSPENLVSIQRDAFLESEVLRIFDQPLFKGCLTPARVWVPGKVLVQDHLYWGYILSFLTGMRPGEIGRIELDDIQEDGGIYYLHLRGFDPSKGRVARKDVKRFKTASSHRVIPLHPLIIDLGLLDRIADLRRLKCKVLFPEWEPYPKPGGELRWGQPLTKSFQYLKKKAGLERFDTALYSARHWFADLLDHTDIKHTTRMRVMGHAGGKDTPSRYGSKSRLTTRDLAQITLAQKPELLKVAELLLTAKELADSRKITMQKPWLIPANWSQHYRKSHHGQMEVGN